MPQNGPKDNRLGRHMNDRRLDLGLRWDQVADAAGVSEAALHALRRDGITPRELTQRGIENALGWEPGSVAAVIGGGKPVISRGSAQPGGLSAQCELELRVLRSDILSDDQKRRFIAAHRAEEPEHQWCRFTEAQVQAGIASLAAAASGQPEVTWPSDAQTAAG